MLTALYIKWVKTFLNVIKWFFTQIILILETAKKVKVTLYENDVESLMQKV